MKKECKNCELKEYIVVTITDDGKCRECGKKLLPDFKLSPTPPINEYYNDPIFQLLNCYEIDGSEIHEGVAHIDSEEARILTQKIRTILAQP